jgi:hypothetical protein
MGTRFALRRILRKDFRCIVTSDHSTLSSSITAYHEAKGIASIR